MCSAETPLRLGAYLPSVSAPPAPATLWRIAQLMRNSSAPLAALPVPPRYCLDGIPGPTAFDPTNSASARTCWSVNWDGFCSSCGPDAAAGIRPVETWNCTEAAPTPRSEGAWFVPSRFIPWQVAQFAWNSFEPSVSSCWLAAVVDALAVVLNSAYAPPVATRPMRISAMDASGERRPVLRPPRTVRAVGLLSVDLRIYRFLLFRLISVHAI